MRGVLSKVWSTALILGALLTMAAYQNCGVLISTMSSNLPKNKTIQVSGTIEHSTLDGCRFLISSVDKSTGRTIQYVLVQMDPSLLQDGNVVSVKGTVSKRLVGTCVAGPLIQVDEATVLSEAL